MISKLKEKDNKKNVKNEKYPAKENNVGAQELFDILMKSAIQYINETFLPVKRDIEDQKFELKRLRMRNKELEMEIKALGIAISELGLCDTKILSDIKNIVRDKIGVTDTLGNIKGKNDIRRFNLTPASNKLMIQTGAK